MKKRLRLVAALAVVVVLFAAFSAAPATAAKKKAPKLAGSITVSAAASLTEVFTRMGTDFQKANKGTTVTFNYAASSALAAQIQGGAPADVFASADGSNMQKVVTTGQVTADPADFTANQLTIVVKPGNPKGVKKLADLSTVGIVSECAAAVPCGKYATQMFTQDGITVPQDKVTLGQDVKATLAAVQTGDADAAVVYKTDAKAAGKTVTEVKIPASLNVIAVYPIAPIAASQNATLADAWISYVLSPTGQKTLAKFGFLPVPATG
ncbi:MAG: molybdate ABC transporter substrate-binding protein [Acidimicrobiia bacterium]